MTEATMLRLLKEYVKKHKIRVPNPDYRESGTYSPQWKIYGAIYYYQLPHRGQILAIRHGDHCAFVG